MFLNTNKNVEFDQAFLRLYKLDSYLEVPMSSENYELPPELASALNKWLRAFRGVDKTEKKDAEEFLTELRKHEKLLNQWISTDQIVKECFDQVHALRTTRMSQPVSTS